MRIDTDHFEKKYGDHLKQVVEILHSLHFYKSRCNALQKIQSKMRDPERKMVCDILANGSTAEEGISDPKSESSSEVERIAREAAEKIKDCIINDQLPINVAGIVVEAINEALVAAQVKQPRIEKMRGTLQWIIDQEGMFFAECSLAEEILERCKKVLGIGPEPQGELAREDEGRGAQ